MIKWIRGKWRYTLTTDGLTALIQIDDTGGLDPEEVLYPDDYPRPLLSREFGDDEDMKIELLKITGLSKATLKKQGFARVRLTLGLRVCAFKDVSVGLTFFPYPQECEHYYEQRLKEYKVSSSKPHKICRSCSLTNR